MGDTSLGLWHGGGGGGGGASGGGGSSSSSSSCPRGSAARRRGKGKMDPNRIIQALKGTIDPKLRIAAENELNQVRGADGPGRDPPAACPAPAPPRLASPRPPRGTGPSCPAGRGAGGGRGWGGRRGAPPPPRRQRPLRSLRSEGRLWDGGPRAAALPLRGMQRKAAPGRGAAAPSPPPPPTRRRSGPFRAGCQPPARALGRGGRARAACAAREPGPSRSGCRDPRGGVCRCETCRQSERAAGGGGGARPPVRAAGAGQGWAGSLPSGDFVLNFVTLRGGGVPKRSAAT